MTGRRCEESPGLASGEPKGGIRETIQTSFLALDCFAALAMTETGQAAL
ncbi:hypothetical protein ACVIJ6_007293 [Bradyrhizobium sp. USDA 4369]